MLYMMGNGGLLWSQCRGIRHHLELIWNTLKYYTSCLDIILLLTCEGVLGDSLDFRQGNQGSLHFLLGTRNCSACNAGESGLISQRWGRLMVFLELRGNLVYILELRKEWSFKTGVCSVPSGLLSIYDVHLGNLN